MSSRTFTFYYFNDSVQLKLWPRYGAIFDDYYPQTYTVQECLEDFCDRIGYGFVDYQITGDTSFGATGTFDFVTQRGEIIFSKAVRSLYETNITPIQLRN